MATPDAVIALANYFQFYRRQKLSVPQVESRMLLWCKSGHGAVVVNSTRLLLQPGDFLFLPWRHSITYLADETEPFLLAGIHIIPRHARRRKVELAVAHSPSDPLADSRWRGDCELAGLSGIVRGRIPAGGPLSELAEYIVELFVARRAAEWQLRCLARLLLAELADVARGGAHSSNPPAVLEQLTRYVHDHLREKLSLTDLVRHSGYSTSTVARLFRTHLRMTPLQWITRTKLDQAARLLATTTLRIHEIGTRVGIEDPYYFSKLFKRTHGVTASAWRRRTRVI